MLKIKTFFFAIFFLLFNHLLSAEDITVSLVTEEAYPLSYHDPIDSKVKGFATEIIQRVMDDAGLNYTITVLPWPRAYKKALTEPNTLVYSLGRLPDREDLFIWLNKIINIEYNFYTQDEKLLNATLIDIINLPVAVIRESVSHLILKKRGFKNFFFINNASHASQLFVRNRISLIFGSSLWFAEVMKENPPPSNRLPIDDFDALTIELYFAINPKSDPIVVNKIRKSMKKIVKDGSFKKIINSY